MTNISGGQTPAPYTTVQSNWSKRRVNASSPAPACPIENRNTKAHKRAKGFRNELTEAEGPGGNGERKCRRRRRRRRRGPPL